ncbi:Ig-like domain-containing protein [Pseudomonas sp. Marseille-Q0931]|uniref:Ig-like domain-containing protein n=1 Tax=Pseudomonas sp. Marseille-Q0931 TaxID=2697507 RepID=UPI0023B960B4|nr:Ig-like domain-containing protein [Pseudomonas sp. Marseille-Q0931]
MALSFIPGQMLWYFSSNSDNSNASTAQFADFDGDGDLDIYIGVERAAGSQGSQIWKNDGAGNFTLHQTFPAARVVQSWLVNIDNDPELELITRSYDSPLQIWQNNGNGTFTAGATIGSNVRTADIGDLDNDGDLDIFVGNFQGNYAVYKNNGSGAFTLSSSPAKVSDPLSLTLVDLDKDGDQDVVAVEENSIRILRNDGSGGFTQLSSFGDVYGGIARSADLTGDGYADALVSGMNGPPANLILFENNGSGTIGTQLQVFNSSEAPGAFADVDGDGYLDGLGQKLMINNGSGVLVDSGFTFQDGAFTYYGAPVNGRILAAGDVDGDGDLDLAVAFYSMDWATYTYSAAVKIFINNSTPPTNADGTLTPAPGVSEPVGLPASADTVGEAVNVFDFTLTDGGGGDNVALGVSSLVVHTSGTGDFSKVTWRLNGDDANNVIGTYSAATNTITFAGLNISVNDGGAETYTINAYYNDTTGLAGGQTYILSIDGDTDVTTTAGTRMQAGQTAVTNGTGTEVIVNAAPTATNLTQTVSYTEDAPSVALGDIVVTDPDGDILTVTLTLSNPVAGSLSTGTFGGATSTYNAGTGVWTVVGVAGDVNLALAAVAFAPAANWDQDITITTRVRDTLGSGPADGVITLDVTPVNDAPTDIALSAATVSHSGGINASVGSLSTTDVDTGQTHTYTLVSGMGDTHNALFSIQGGMLRANDAAALAPGAYSVRVATSDGSATFEKSFTITATDDVAPIVTSITRDGAASTNATSLGYTITFSEAVTGVDISDFALGSTGTANGTITSISGFGSSYTLTVSDVSGDGTLGLYLNAAATGISDISGNPILGGFVGQSYTIDTTPPSASIVVADATLAAGETSTVTITFSEAVTGLTEDDLTVANGTLSALSSSDGGITWTTTLTPTANISAPTNLITLDKSGVSDLAGNAGTGIATSNNYAVDTARPSATIVVTDNVLTIGETSLVVITFSEAVLDFTLSDLSVSNGSLSGLNSSDGGVTWTLNLTPNTGVADATNLITLDLSGVKNISGNAGIGRADSNNYAIDTVAPTVGSVSVPANGTYGIGADLTFTVNFSEAINVGGAPRIAMLIGADTYYASYVSGSGTSALQFSAIVQPGWLDANGITVSSLSLNGGRLTDLNGNDAVLTLNSVGSTAAVLVDGIAPSAPSVPTLQPASDTGVSNNDGITRDTTPTLTGTAESGATVSLYVGTTLLGSTTADGAGNWSITSSALADGSHALTVQATDAAGNKSVFSSPLLITIDTTAPAFDSAGSTPVDDATGVSITSDLVLKFSEPLSMAGSDLSRVYLKSTATDTLVPATITINADGALVINPTASLAYGTSYYITWDAGALQDLAGNAAAAVTDKTTYNFTAQPVPSSPQPTPTPGPDGDNVSTEEENAVPGLPTPGGGAPLQGDGNGDGILDSQQREVTSLMFRQTGQISTDPSALQTPLTLVANSLAGQISPDGSAQITYLEQMDAPAVLPGGLSAPLGLLAFATKVDIPGSVETFSLFVDASLGINGYFKQNASGVWVNLADPANGGQIVTEYGKTRLDFVIQDGGEFDSDGKADGIITDPGILGILAENVACPHDPFRIDADQDQIPDAIELLTGTDVNQKDNDVFGNASQWVNQLWRDLYGREGHGDSQAAELASQLSQGNIGKVEVLSQVLGSSELDTHAAAIIRLYHAILDRSPELCGYNYWLARANENVGQAQIGEAFLNSPEFMAQHADLSNSQFVDFIYQNVLGRAADAEGGAWWLDKIDTGVTTRGGMLYGVSQSSEYKAAMADDVAVDLLYLGLLNRAPDAEGRDFWLQHYAAIGDVTQFMAVSTATTAEYHDRFLPSDGNAIGIVGVPAVVDIGLG